jgi:putative acetyltransferase
MELAPMSVLPDMQRRGIGTQLVKQGIENLERNHCPFIIVVGHAEYYPRFGFERASACGVKCQWDGVPDEVFMILWLDKSTMPPVSGLAKYHEEFSESV